MPKVLCLELIEIESIFTNIGSSNENNVNFQNCVLGTQQIYNCEFSINQSIFETSHGRACLEKPAFLNLDTDLWRQVWRGSAQETSLYIK